MIGKVLAASEKRQQCGEDGYLNETCVAPPGQDQRDYTRDLFRAVWCYIDILGGPDEPLSVDENTLALTKERYPYLGDGHIVDALNHVHV